MTSKHWKIRGFFTFSLSSTCRLKLLKMASFSQSTKTGRESCQIMLMHIQKVQFLNALFFNLSMRLILWIAQFRPVMVFNFGWKLRLWLGFSQIWWLASFSLDGGGKINNFGGVWNSGDCGLLDSCLLSDALGEQVWGDHHSLPWLINNVFSPSDPQAKLLPHIKSGFGLIISCRTFCGPSLHWNFLARCKLKVRREIMS